MQLIDRIGRRLKLQDLNVLMTVIQAGSMAKAADRLNTSQPNISRAIADLEHAFGVRLLDRQPRGVEPTAFGRALLDCGLAVFDDLRQGVKSIEHLADPATGELRIGANHFLAASIVPTIIDRLSTRYPGITFRLVTGDGRTNLRKLKERELDLLVAWRSPPYADQQLAFEMLYEDALVIVAGARHPLAKRRNVRLAELLNEPWVLPEGDIGPVALSIFRVAGLEPPNGRVLCFSTDIRITLLASGRLLTICATSMLQFPKHRSDVKVLAIDVRPPKVPIGIVTLKNRSVGPVAHLFVECAREVAGRLGKAEATSGS
jgi:DNA-binding transcriptional LysR family regulator